MAEVRTIGVIGTFVWDRIVDPVGAVRFEGWGGLTYALSALSVALPTGWSILPIVKVGKDLADPIRVFLGDVPGIDPSALVEVSEPNNRVELHYLDRARRTERLSGGVPGWLPEELEPRVGACHALLVNFISGHELTLGAARWLRAFFEGPLYADLHSLFLGAGEDGLRSPRRLPEWEEWTRCFDSIQMNEDEFALVGDGDSSSWRRAEDALRAGTRLVLVTLAERGCAYLEREDSDGGRLRRGSVTLLAPRKGGDPTGCGDVWGATMFARLLAGDDVRTAAGEANRLASSSVDQTGAEGLIEHLNRASGGASD